MSAKTSPARRAAFFKALGETGNYGLAAAHAKVSRSWVSQHKAADADFAARCDAAVAAAAVSLRARGEMTPPARWRWADGEALVIRAGNGRRAVLSRAAAVQWCPRTEAVFLTALAGSANVRASCAAAGMSVASAYVHRAKWPGFATRWRAALETGYVKLEFATLMAACNSIEGAAWDPGAPLPRMRVDEAIALLHLHRGRVRGVGARSGRDPWKALPDIETVRADILRKIAVLKRGQAAGLGAGLVDAGAGAWPDATDAA
jgi:hypothetical protein